MKPQSPPLEPTGPPPWLAPLALALKPFRRARVVAAVSGGGDSVALLRALLTLRDRLALRLSVATLDHSTRGGQSSEDAAFVADLAGRLGLPCDSGRWQADRPGGRSADARRARYAWLAEVARARGASVVATGHTRDDQAETILHRVIRGTGLRGLGGMSSARPLGSGVTLVRPLLGVGRTDLRAYLVGLGQDWREDPTNAEITRTRSRIRHDLLPRLTSDYNSAVTEALVRLGTLAADASARIDRRAARLLGRVALDRGPAWITLDRNQLRRLGPGDRADLLRMVWHELGWPEGGMDHARWLRLDASACSRAVGRSAVGSGVEAVATPDRWTLRQVPTAAAPTPAALPFALHVPGTCLDRGGRLGATLGAADSEWPATETGDLVERLDADRIVGECTVRPPRAGDRFDPLGLEGHSQALADLLRGRRVASADRAVTPVVTDSVGIIWVVGHRIAHRVRRTSATRRVLELRWEQLAQDQS